MKQRTIILIAMLASLFGVRAQKLTVEKMAAAPMDLSASQYERKDLTGKPCGLVKVQLATTGARFEGNVIGKADYKTGEYWVYMSEGSYMLSVKHPSFVPLNVNFRHYNITGVVGKTTYILTLLMPQGGGGNVDDGMRYLAMTVEPKEAVVYIDEQPQVLQNGTLSVLLPMGEHRYRVEASAYEAKSGTFTIGDETLQLPVRLESSMASLGINATTAGTQIYVNDQLRGTSSWTGSLAAGTYRIEGRLDGYRSHRQTVTLTQRDRQTVTIPALDAIVGNLNVNYQPLNAEVWVDGSKLGTSPGVFRNLGVGIHEVELRKSGYASKKERVRIEDGLTATLTGALEALSQPAADTGSGSGATLQSLSPVIQTLISNMVRVEGGTFTMGATSEQGSDAIDVEKPAHQVTLSSFSIGKYEVTQEEWEVVMGRNPSKFKGAKLPVEQVSWKDCQKFISKLNQLTGKQFRLPTEAEWEYAARGGNRSRGYKYAGGDNVGSVAWYIDNSNSQTHPVGQKSPNELGLYDMSGNVWEWCQDWYGAYSSGSQTNPTGPSSGSNRVNRGGSWGYFAWFCRSSYRCNSAPSSYRHSNFGLRLAL